MNVGLYNYERKEYMSAYERYLPDLRSQTVVDTIASNSQKAQSYSQMFDQDVSGWNVSNVTVMAGMFKNTKPFNQDISSWDVSAVTNMESMFFNAASFNQNISSWGVTNVTTMHCMFYNATSFNQDISSWDVSNVMDFHGMFYNSKFDARTLPCFSENMVHTPY